MRRASEMAHVERIVQVGQRGIGSARPSDWVDACKAGVAFVPAREVHAAGVAPALALVPEGARVVVAFDVDALDPAIMPGVIAPSPGGLSYWQVAELLHGISGKAAIAGFDIVEFLPERDTGDMGAMVAGRLIANVLGLIARAGLPAA
jgi:agmatinase